MKARRLFLFAACLFISTRLALAGDWPQWRGPDRTGVSTETGLLKQWPQEGPKLLWKATGLGGGFSTPSIVAGRIYLMGTKGGNEYVFALDVKDGKEIWSSKVGPIASAGYAGPRATPTTDGDYLYTLGSDSDLVCMEMATGKVVWQKNLQKNFGGRRGKWAYAESPLIDGDVLICTPGGSEATLLALNKKTGAVIWKAAVPGGDAAAYSSVIVAEAGNVKQYVQFLSRGVVGVDAKTGKYLWRYNKTANGTANIPTPIFHDGFVFSASGYGTGGGLVKLTAGSDSVSASEVYFTRDMANHHGGVVRIGDHLYGTNEGNLLCLDFKTGARKWQDRSVGKGSVTYADGHLYVRSERGPIALVEATPTGYKEKGRFDQPNRSKERAWPHPVVANGRLYLRDQDILLCYDVKQN
jgi:outer membrane protein assembly factor BamB